MSNFFIDFPSEKENYDQVIDIVNSNNIEICRGNGNNIIINDLMVDEKHCCIKREGKTFGWCSNYFWNTTKQSYQVKIIHPS